VNQYNWKAVLEAYSGDTCSRNVYQKLSLNRTQLCSVQVSLPETFKHSRPKCTMLVTCVGVSFL